MIGVIGAILTHGLILIYLIKIDYNTIVYPWNIAMGLFVIILFFRNPDKLEIWTGIDWRLKALNLFGILLFLFMPIFCLFNLWDDYLSFRLYSGKTNVFYVCIAKDEVDKIDQRLHKYFWNIEEVSGGEMISVNKWAMEELNVPFYPETRVFRHVAKSFCGLGIDNDKLISVEFGRNFEEGDAKTFKCDDLQAFKSLIARVLIGPGNQKIDG